MRRTRVEKYWPRKTTVTVDGERVRDDAANDRLGFFRVIIRILPGPVRPPTPTRGTRCTVSSQSCSSLFVVVPVAVRLNSSGPMFLPTRTERCVFLPIPFLYDTNPSHKNYLGHSINAPTGRWQKNKDVHWYNRDKNDSQDQRAEEIRTIKEAEAEALSIALYVPPVVHFTSPDTRGVVLGHPRRNRLRVRQVQVRTRSQSLPRRRQVRT